MVEHGVPAHERGTGSLVGLEWRPGCTLVGVLGVGGSATVYLSTFEGGDEVAVKVLHREWMQDAEIRGNFEREARLLTQVGHPGLPMVKGVGMLPDGEPFYVMERLRGALLTDVLLQQGGRLTTEDACHVADSVLEVLSAVHDRGLVHRDIKPSNLFITLDGEVKLLDLGAALDLGAERDRPASRLIGSPNYMAPEQSTNATLGVDRRSDVFAVGATMYHMLTGQLIRSGWSVDELFDRASSVPAPALSGLVSELGPGIKSVVDKALSWVPADRYADARDMRSALQEAVAGSRAPGALDGASRQSLRNALARGWANQELRPAAERVKLQAGLRDFFRHLGRLATGLSRKSQSVSAWQERLALASSALSMCFEVAGSSIDVEICPHSFAFEGAPVWEPEAGLEEVPYEFFQSGFRSLRFERGGAADELERLASLLALEPLKSGSGDDDLATSFFEMQFVGITAVILGSLDMGFLEVYDRLLRDSEADGVSVNETAQAGQPGSSELVELVSLVGGALLRESEGVAISWQETDWDKWELSVTDGRWSPNVYVEPETLAKDWTERRHRVVARAYQRAVADCQEAIVLKQVRDRIVGLQRAGRSSEAMYLLAGVGRFCKPELMTRLLDYCLSGDVFKRLLLGTLTSRSTSSDPDFVYSEGFAVMMRRLSDRFVMDLLDVWQTLMDGGDSILTGIVSERLRGNESAFASLLPQCSESVGVQVLTWMAETGSDLPYQFALPALDNSSARVRAACLSILMSYGHSNVIPALEALLRDPDARARKAALRLLDRSGTAVVAPLLEQIACEARFHTLPLLERRAILVLLHRYTADRARHVLDRLLKPTGWRPKPLEQSTRELAASCLVAFFPDATAAALLRREIGRFWRTPADLRTVFHEALSQLGSVTTQEGLR